jgi:hypothetical protein
MAHHFGAGGAVQILRHGDDTPVRDIVSPAVMKANPHLRGKTVASLKAFAHKAATGKGVTTQIPDFLSFEDTQQLRNMAVTYEENVQKVRDDYLDALVNEPVDWAINNQPGFQQIDWTSDDATLTQQIMARIDDYTDLRAQGYAEGVEVTGGPLGSDDITQLKARLEEGDTDTTLRDLQMIGRFGPFSEDVFRQLDEGDGRLGFVGRMMDDDPQGNYANAYELIEGHKLYENNKSVANATIGQFLGVSDESPGKFTAEYNAVVKSAFAGFEHAQAIQDLSKGLLYQKIASGELQMALTQGQAREALQEVVEQVVGGEFYDGGGSYDRPIILPKGVSGDMFEDALSNITDADLPQLSMSGNLPWMAERDLPDADFFEEATPIMMGMGSYAWIQQNTRLLLEADENGEPSSRPWIMDLDQASVMRLAHPLEVIEAETEADLDAREAERLQGFRPGEFTPSQSMDVLEEAERQLNLLPESGE